MICPSSPPATKPAPDRARVLNCIRSVATRVGASGGVGRGENEYTAAQATSIAIATPMGVRMG